MKNKKKSDKFIKLRENVLVLLIDRHASITLCVI